MLALRNRHFFLIDLALLSSVAMLAFALRLDAAEMLQYGTHILLFLALALPVKLVTFRLLGIYRRYWRYASIEELVLISVAVGSSSAIVAGLLFALIVPLTQIAGFPRSIPFIDALLTLLAVGGPRFAVRFIEQNRQRKRREGAQESNRRVLVIGAGDAGGMIVKEMRSNPQLGLAPVGLVDDDQLKRGVQIHGVPVLGTREDIPELAQKYRVSEVIIAMPTAPGCAIREILDICNQAGVPARTIPGMYDILSGQVSVSQIREVNIEDLLRREPVKIDTVAVQAFVRGRRVLVSGAGGSIGSELCRQIVRMEPEQLVLLGHGENSVFKIHGELANWEIEKIVPVIADTRDKGRLAQVFDKYRPELVFHAAAHKHVPLMEANSCEAVVNNVLGTRNLVQTAEGNGVSHFILISTDKAVNPTSVMGCTKRVAELIVYQAARRNGRCFTSVRFGNVLGSRGSVSRTFQQQIAQGVPVTVTDPEMRRYFMTIPEAVQLVLQAAAIGRGGEIFVLDMGEPVRILDLATDLIWLSGLKPSVEIGDRGLEDREDWDIEIVFTGVRPGEKLFEELFREEHVRTRHEKILVATNDTDSGSHILGSDLDEQVDRLISVAQTGDEAGVRQMLREIVPEYRSEWANKMDQFSSTAAIDSVLPAID